MAAHAAKQGVPTALEADVRAFARSERERGADIARVLVDVKEMLREAVGDFELVFRPKVIGWTVAGFFAGTSKRRDEGLL